MYYYFLELRCVAMSQGRAAVTAVFLMSSHDVFCFWRSVSTRIQSQGVASLQDHKLAGSQVIAMGRKVAGDRKVAGSRKLAGSQGRRAAGGRMGSQRVARSAVARSQGRWNGQSKREER